MEQVKAVFSQLTSPYVLRCVCDERHEKAAEMRSFVSDFCSCSERLTAELLAGESGELQFSIERGGKDGGATGIMFRGIPGGHEFTSLLLAVLNADGIGKNLPDDGIVGRLRALRGGVTLRTYMSLSCTNCPDVVQALNVVALMNDGISHEVVDGALWQDEVQRMGVQGVPAVFASDDGGDGELLHVGRGDLGTLLGKLEERYGGAEVAIEPVEREYDVVVVGGGPAGSSAAIYSARKGLRVAVVGERIGGQVKDTVGIENLISVPQTTGEKLAADLKEHISRYSIDAFENRTVLSADLGGKTKRLT